MGNAELQATTTPWFRRVLNGAGAEDLAVQYIGAEQSNSSAIFGNRIVMKMFRRAQEGVNPDLEIGRYLTEMGFPHTAPLLGTLEYARGVRSEPRTISVVYAYVPNEGDAWHYTQDQLSIFYESALHTIPEELTNLPAWPSDLSADVPLPAEVAEAVGPFLDSAELLGRRTAELHRALAAGEVEAFAPEPFTTLYQRSVYQSMRSQVRPTLSLVRRTLGRLDDGIRPLAETLLEREAEILDRFSAVRAHRIDVSRIRVHGDYHLGQVLHAGRDFVIIDFEGEPSRSPTERRIKRSAITDVAGMIRSFQYATAAGLRTMEERGMVRPEQREDLARRGRVWEHWVTWQFLRGYLDEAGNAPFVPSDPDDLQVLLLAYTLDKALYEVRYELNNRPTWADIPLRGVQELLDAEVGGPSS
jgi:maltose alpha-D-glucosyltransferase/alpha-amylase